AAAVFMNLRRVKPLCLRLFWLIGFPFLSSSLINDHRLGEAVEKTAGIVPHQRELSRHDDHITRNLYRHFCPYLGELLGGARHAESAVGRLRAQQEMRLRESRLE